MTIRLIFIITCFLASSCSGNTDKQQSESSKLLTVLAAEFKQKIDTNKFILIDLKTKQEHDKERIPGSILIDFFDNDFEKKIKSLDKNKKYLIYCHGGERSFLVLRLMEKLGFKEVYELKKGITSWKSTGYEAVREEN